MKEMQWLALVAQAFGMAEFWDCPLVEVSNSTTPESFFEDFGTNPRPIRMRIPGDDSPFDFFGTHGQPGPGGSQTFGENLNVGGRSHYGGYVLTNMGYTPGVFQRLELATRFAFPRAVSTIDQRPVLSIGLEGTGERDLAHHYHPATIMRLLQGRKIWALRSPDDEECMWARGTCTDPFLVCDYYARSTNDTEPPCVQNAGETILVPDGWYHGTCNTQTTVGYGMQGRSLRLQPPACFHCNARDARGQMPYASTASGTPLLSVSGAQALAEILSAEAPRYMRSPGPVSMPFLHLGSGVAQATYMSFRSLFAQFVVQSHLEAEENSALRSPDCSLVLSALGRTMPAKPLDARTLGSLRSTAHASLVLHVQGPPLTLRLRHRASAEVEELVLQPRHAALWLGDALDSLTQDADTTKATDALVVCRVAFVPPPPAVHAIEGQLAGRHSA